jgi:hypothetical protein
MLLLPQITTVEIGLDVLGGSDLLAWRQDMQLASAAPGGAAAATTTQAKPPPTHDTRIVLALTLFLNLNLTLIRLSDRTLIRSLTIILTLARRANRLPRCSLSTPATRLSRQRPQASTR